MGIRWSAVSSWLSTSNKDSLLSPSPNKTYLLSEKNWSLLKSYERICLKRRYWSVDEKKIFQLMSHQFQCVKGRKCSRWSLSLGPWTWVVDQSPDSRCWCDSPCCRRWVCHTWGSSPHMSPTHCDLKHIIDTMKIVFIWMKTHF